MSQQALRDEYILPEHNVIGLDGQPVNIEPPAGMLANALAEEEAKPKRGRKPGSKNKPKKARAKKSKPAVVPSAAATPGAVPAIGSQAVSGALNANGSDGMVARFRRIKADDRLWVLVAVAGALTIGTLWALTGVDPFQMFR